MLAAPDDYIELARKATEQGKIKWAISFIFNSRWEYLAADHASEPWTEWLISVRRLQGRTGGVLR
jgi:hypothetical protein